MKSFLAYSYLAFVLACAVANSQVATGVPAFGSFGGGPFDTVNLGNLNVHFAIPVLHKAGRRMSFTYDLGYDNSIWYPATCPSGTGTCWTPVSNWGWRGVTEATTGFVSYAENDGGIDGQGCNVIVYSYVYHDTFGVPHNFSQTVSSHLGGHNCIQTTFPRTLTTTDGSGYYVVLSSFLAGTMHSRSGSVINAPFGSGSGAGTATDANGNQITVNSSGQFFDTLSPTTAVLTVAGTAPSPTTYTYRAPAGSQHYTMNYTQYSIRTAFGCSSVGEYTGTAYLVSSIVLPDTTEYTFTYDSTTGRLLTVSLPTGGTITYTYTDGSNDGIVCTDGSTHGLTRTLSPGGEWKYDRSVSGSNWTTTVTSPPDPQNAGSASDITTINFEKDTTTGGTNNYYETQRVVNQAASTVLATTIICYNGISVSTPASCGTTAVASPVNRRTVFTYLPTSSGQQAETDINYLSGTNLPTDVYTYDFGSAAVGPLLRHVQTTYNNTLGNGIIDHPAITKTYDGRGNLNAQTTYTYDENIGSLATSGATQHIGITGSRGNLTTLAVQANSTTTLYRKFYYYDTGMLNTSNDVSTSNTTNGATTTYNYASSASSCDFAFPTSISEPLSLSRSMTWDCNGGVGLTVTDENGKVTTVHYSDADFRRPDYTLDKLSNKTTLTYTLQTAVESNLTFNGVNSVSDFRTTVDAFGRPILSQRAQTPSLAEYDSSETDYNIMGQASRSTMPFQSAAGVTSSTAPGNAAVYDALGRPTLVTDAGGGTVSYTYTKNDVLQTVGPGQNFSKQLEYDGLGRLKSVCEITSATGSGSCGQVTAKTGYWTTYTYNALGQPLTVTQNAQAGTTSQQTRAFVYDSIGRMTSESNPETSNTGANGTTVYVYDTIAAPGICGGYLGTAGDLLQVIKPAGDWTCYFHDALHRLTDVGNSDQAGSHCKRFRYDNDPGYPGSTKPTGLTNTLGRLIEAATDHCDTGDAIITDEWFSYSSRGELTDVYEKTPNSGGYYHTTAQYWATGTLETLSGIPGVPTINYGATGAGLDGEGRITQVAAASGPNPVTGVTYSASGTTNPVGALTGVTFGSADSDSFTYDPSTGRMATYTFSVNSQTDEGTLTWNSNGTLNQLLINDQITGTSDSQTCNYTYDDLARIGGKNPNGFSVDCGSTKWQQLFTYDAFGNITKSGTSSFIPGYSPTQNQFTSIPGRSVSYDGDGNLRTDNLNTYTWDVYGRMSTVSTGSVTVTATYDALDLVVEQYNGSTYTQILYSPVGKTALMSGSTLTKAFVNLPGGGTAIYNSSGLAYYRHSDHLGSSRLTSTQARGLYSSQAYAPFGEQYTTYPTAGSLDPSYTGQNSDAVPSLYDFTFREHSMSQGRWISPDSLGIGAVNPSNPQTWNRYAYVGNSPLNFVDPSGLQQKGPSGGGCNSEEYDCGSSGGGPSSPGAGSDVYINGLFAGQFYGTVIPITVWNGERLGSMGVVIFGGWMAGGDPCTNFVLQDCGAGGAANNKPASCQSVTPAQFDYTTPQIYMGENGNPVIQSAQQHIQQGHIFPGEAGNTMYGIFPWPGTNAAFQQVQVYNAATFTFGQASQASPNGNITFTLTFPVTINPFNKLPAVIGYDLYSGPGVTPLNTNKLVLAANCKLVRTSFPTFP